MARGCEHFAVEVEFGKDGKIIVHVSSLSGIDLRYIQKILRHANSKSTEIYTHMSKASIARVTNPHDTIFKEEKL
ncbi:hypothetical protein J7J62_04205 [bacterium]|nr:hypothetical protein [bacterium]